MHLRKQERGRWIGKKKGEVGKKKKGQEIKKKTNKIKREEKPEGETRGG